MLLIEYETYHRDTKTTHKHFAVTENELTFLRVMDGWNRAQPDKWSYWLSPGKAPLRTVDAKPGSTLAPGVWEAKL